MQIKLKQGVIRGIADKTFPSEKTIYSFIGIPFAEPPVKNLRFKPPHPAKPWNGILDATQLSKICTQKDLINNAIFGEEDCLYLNVQIPQDPKHVTKHKAVMVFIHGGAFVWGSGDMYSGEYLVEHDVIFVTINYRLHVLGFLNLGLPECPGNVGLKDLVLGLKWVKDNIKEFGGDSNNITIVGESAGAVCVSYLMLSPMVKDLFHKIILQSGHPFCPWAFNENPVATAFELGKYLEYSGSETNRKELLNFLMEIPAAGLLEAQYVMLKNLQMSAFQILYFSPSVEFHDNTEDRFIPEHPEELLKKVIPLPMITGVNDLEGLIISRGYSNSKGTLLSELNDNVDFFVPPTWRSTPGVVPGIANKVKQFYFKDKKISDDSFQEFIDLLSDVNFFNRQYDIPRTILQKDPTVPVFIYRFSYEGEMNVLKRFIMGSFPDSTIKRGSAHADELFYLFKMKRTLDLFSNSFENEKNMIGVLSKLWTNFAKFGTPDLSTSEFRWKPTSIDEPCYLQIDDNPQLKYAIIAKSSSEFWEKLSKEVQMQTRFSSKL